jgi:hypothetical protein
MQENVQLSKCHLEESHFVREKIPLVFFRRGTNYCTYILPKKIAFFLSSTELALIFDP